jgi:hypothetical protein
LRVALAECDKLLLVPVIVSARLPVVALLPTLTVRVEDPEPETELGLKLAFTRDPVPLTLRLTLPANPFTLEIVTV